jgi:hypothetical protein
MEPLIPLHTVCHHLRQDKIEDGEANTELMVILAEELRTGEVIASASSDSGSNT